MTDRPSFICLRGVFVMLLALMLGAALGGCAGGTVDRCPYVRNENPSLLQGRTASVP